jgi:hypothetical protein
MKAIKEKKGIVPSSSKSARGFLIKQIEMGLLDVSAIQAGKQLKKSLTEILND